MKTRPCVFAMARHADKAFWFSKAAPQFVTSSYYCDEYPQ